MHDNNLEEEKPLLDLTPNESINNETPTPPPALVSLLPKISVLRQIGYSLMWMILQGVYQIVFAVLFPRQVELVVSEERKGLYLGLGLAVANLLLVAGIPIFGAASDNSSSRIFGKRIPFIVIGSFLMSGFLVCLGLSNTFIYMFLSFCALCSSVSIITPAYHAVIPDMVPPQQRGQLAAWHGAMGQIGSGLGGFGGFLLSKTSILNVYYITAASISLPLLLASLSIKRNPPLLKIANKNESKERPSIFQMIKTFFFPLSFSNFRYFAFCVLLTRIGDTCFRSFLLYFFETTIKTPYHVVDNFSFMEASSAISFWSILLNISALIIGMITGFLSDKTGRQALIVFAELCLIAVPIASLFSNHFIVQSGLAILYGCGLGTFNAVIFALLADLVGELHRDPRFTRSNASAMGIYSMANLSSKVGFPALLGYALDEFQTFGVKYGYNNMGYIFIFSCGSFCFFLAGILILFVRLKRTKK